MSGKPIQADYTIAAVSKLTGVSCHTLRVWERRYGFPNPLRTASGHRRYGLDQVRILRRIARLMREGRAIGSLIVDLREGRFGEDEGDRWAPDAPPDTTSALVDLLVAGDLDGAEVAYSRAIESRRPDETVAVVIEPALVDVGERWFRRECQIFQERLASSFLLRKLSSLIDEAARANAQPHRRILVGSVQGDRHEGGILMLGLMLELAGWRALALGVDLPVREIHRAVDLLRPDALCLSFTLSRNINKRFGELEKIRIVPVFVGGRSILNYQGLARRRGLIPITNQAARALPQLLDEFDAWTRRHSPISSLA